MMTALYDSQKILLLESQDLAIRDIRASLESLGLSLVATVLTIEETLQAVDQFKPDLVLVNLDLLTAVETAQAIQSQYQIPIVGLIENPDAATLDKVWAIKPFGFVTKPYHCATLGMTIDLAMARHRSEQKMQAILTATQTQNQQLQVQLEQNMEYMAVAAHDLRNPLGVVRSVAEVVTSMGDRLSVERRTRYLKRMLDATENLDELLQSILTYSYIRAGKLDQPPSEIDLVQFCQRQIESLQWDGAPCNFNFQPQADRCTTYLNAVMLEHVIQNLLSNALKYSPPSEDLAASQIDVMLSWDDEIIEMIVQDQGLGIPDENQAHIFEPFFRGENIEEIPGAGLGLAIAEQCAQRQGGAIRFTSTLANGSCFMLELPRDVRLSIEL